MNPAFIYLKQLNSSFALFYPNYCILKNFKKNLPKLLIAFALAAASCQSVKPYQRQYLNDHEMQAGQKNIARQEQNALTYREGAAGGGGGKTGGGCGCN